MQKICELAGSRKAYLIKTINVQDARTELPKEFLLHLSATFIYGGSVFTSAGNSDLTAIEQNNLTMRELPYKIN